MKNIEAGLFIISLGVVWFLEEMGIISWSAIRNIWIIVPALLIMIGINIIFKGVPYIKIITWLLFLSSILAYAYFFKGAVKIPFDGYNKTVHIINSFKQLM